MKPSLILLGAALGAQKSELITDHGVRHSVLEAGDSLVSPYESNVDFLHTGNGVLSLRVNNVSYFEEIDARDAVTHRSKAQLDSTGVLSLLDMNEDNEAVWHSDRPEFRFREPFTMKMEGDRSVRIRDANKMIVWYYPRQPREPVDSLKSSEWNHLRPGESIESPNGQYTISLNEDGLLSSNTGIRFNQVPPQTGDRKRVMILGNDGRLSIVNHKFQSLWESDHVKRPSETAYVLYITDEGQVMVTDESCRTVAWNRPLLVPPPVAEVITDTVPEEEEPVREEIILCRSMLSENKKYELSVKKNGSLVIVSDGKEVKTIVPRKAIQVPGPYYFQIMEDSSFAIMSETGNRVAWSCIGDLNGPPRNPPFSLHVAANGNSVYLRDATRTYLNLRECK